MDRHTQRRSRIIRSFGSEVIRGTRIHFQLSLNLSLGSRGLGMLPCRRSFKGIAH